MMRLETLIVFQVEIPSTLAFTALIFIFDSVLEFKGLEGVPLRLTFDFLTLTFPLDSRLLMLFESTEIGVGEASGTFSCNL